MSACIFCRIAAGDVPAAVLLETERTLAFRDIAPKAPVHVLVIPRSHHATMAELVAGEPDVAAEVLATAAEVARREGIAQSGYATLFNTGRDSGQTVFHAHAHVLGGAPLPWTF